MKKLSIDFLLAKEKIDVSCPDCNHRFKVQFKDVAEDGSIIRCPGCNQDINFIHDDTTKKTIKDSNKALKDFEKALKKFGK